MLNEHREYEIRPKRNNTQSRSLRVRALKRKYGDRNSQANEQNNKSTSRARNRRHRLKFTAGCSDFYNSTIFTRRQRESDPRLKLRRERQQESYLCCHAQPCSMRGLAPLSSGERALVGKLFSRSITSASRAISMIVFFGGSVLATRLWASFGSQTRASFPKDTSSDAEWCATCVRRGCCRSPDLPSAA